MKPFSLSTSISLCAFRWTKRPLIVGIIWARWDPVSGGLGCILLRDKVPRGRQFPYSYREGA
eukprot:scaffold422129_cov18-Prasinocladus_malaysianus.AAC.1